MSLRCFASSIFAGAILAAGASLTATAGPMETLAEIAGEYNVFVLGNMGSAVTPYTSQSQGAIAVGGSLWLQDFAVASRTTHGNAALTVGSDIWQRRGTISGATHIGGNANFTRDRGGTTIQGTLDVHGRLLSAPTSVGTIHTGVSAAALPLDFSAIGDELRAAAAFLADDGADQGLQGTVQISSGSVTLTGTSTELNVFTMTAAQMAALGNTSFTIRAPAGSTVIVNVSGTNVRVGAPGNFGFNYSGVGADHVLFNFYEATQLTMRSFDGSILAPYAAVTFTNGQMNGTLMAAQLDGVANYGNGAFMDRPFAGDLPLIQVAIANSSLPASEVPEPSTLAALAAAAAGFAMLRRRRNMAA